MEQYWNARLELIAPINLNATDNITQPNNDSVLSKFDHHHLTLLANQTQKEGWLSEKHQYLKDLPTNVTKDIDIVKWWQVCAVMC